MAKFKAYRLTLTPTAKATYRHILATATPLIKCGNEQHSAVKTLRIVDECLDKLIPHDPFSKDRALSGELSNIFRVKKGRMRICYIASSTRYEIVVLYISETPRKQGDRNDPYALFSKLVMSGEYAEIFELLDVRPPARKD